VPKKELILRNNYYKEVNSIQMIFNFLELFFINSEVSCDYVCLKVLHMLVNLFMVVLISIIG